MTKHPLLYSIPEIFQLYESNKEQVHAHLKGEVVECYDGEGTVYLTTGLLNTLVVLAVISLALWLWALLVTISRWGKLDSGKRTACIVLLILSWLLLPIILPIVVLFIVYSA